MPNLKKHCKSCLERYGYSFEEIHKWMDEPVEIAMGGHRAFRHDYRTTPKEAQEIFWDYVSKEYRPFIKHAVIDHLILDKRTKRGKEKEPIYLKLDKPKSMRYVAFHLEKMRILCRRVERDLDNSKQEQYLSWKTPRKIADNFANFVYEHTRNSIKHYPPYKKVKWVTDLYDILNEFKNYLLKINGKRIPAYIKEERTANKLIEIKDRIEEIVDDAYYSIEMTKETEEASVRAMAEMNSIEQIFKSGKDLLNKKNE